MITPRHHRARHDDVVDRSDQRCVPGGEGRRLSVYCTTSARLHHYMQATSPSAVSDRPHRSGAPARPPAAEATIDRPPAACTVPTSLSVPARARGVGVSPSSRPAAVWHPLWRRNPPRVSTRHVRLPDRRGNGGQDLRDQHAQHTSHKPIAQADFWMKRCLRHRRFALFGCAPPPSADHAGRPGRAFVSSRVLARPLRLPPLTDGHHYPRAPMKRPLSAVWSARSRLHRPASLPCRERRAWPLPAGLAALCTSRARRGRRLADTSRTLGRGISMAWAHRRRLSATRWSARRRRTHRLAARSAQTRLGRDHPGPGRILHGPSHRSPIRCWARVLRTVGDGATHTVAVRRPTTSRVRYHSARASTSAGHAAIHITGARRLKHNLSTVAARSSRQADAPHHGQRPHGTQRVLQPLDPSHPAKPLRGELAKSPSTRTGAATASTSGTSTYTSLPAHIARPATASTLVLYRTTVRGNDITGVRYFLHTVLL